MHATAALPTPQPCRRSAELRAHQPLLRKVAARLRVRLPPHVDMDDLLQAGLIGLNEALGRFESERGASFETYAARRIEGAMLDALRHDDSLSRDARGRQRRLRAAVQRLEHRLGRAPRAQEVADELGWTLAAFHRCMLEAGAAPLRQGDDELATTSDDVDAGSDHATDEQADPLRALQQRQRHAALNRAFDALELRERALMEMIYDRGLALQEVGAELGVTATRAWQLHQSVIGKLKRRLRDW